MASNNSTVLQNERRISIQNHIMYCYAKYGARGKGFTLGEMETWDEKTAAMHFLKAFADLEHACRMMERMPSDVHEVEGEGVHSTLLPLLQNLVLNPAPIEPATTPPNCCPEDVPSA